MSTVDLAVSVKLSAIIILIATHGIRAGMHGGGSLYRPEMSSGISERSWVELSNVTVASQEIGVVGNPAGQFIRKFRCGFHHVSFGITISIGKYFEHRYVSAVERAGRGWSSLINRDKTKQQVVNCNWGCSTEKRSDNGAASFAEGFL